MKPQTPLVIAVLLINAIACVAQTASVPVRKPDVEILVPAGAKDSSTSGITGFPTPFAGSSNAGNSNGSLRHLTWRDPPPTGLQSLFPEREIRRITVVRYIAGRGAVAPEVVRRILFELTRRELEYPTSTIMWSEMNTWTIEATVEFSEGPAVRILTDGVHTCLIDEAGNPWYFRISPAEFQCGFEIPGSTVRNESRNSYCQARGLGVYRLGADPLATPAGHKE
jgi:hypothetical protein